MYAAARYASLWHTDDPERMKMNRITFAIYAMNIDGDIFYYPLLSQQFKEQYDGIVKF
jgi:hypothetical protein